MTKRNLWRMLERERQRHADIEARLIDQLLHVTGHTWTPPPVADAPVVTVAPSESYVFSPEQHV